MQLISKFTKGLFLCVIDIYSKYARVIRLKIKKGITITNAFQKLLDKPNRKPSKIWIDKGSGFYNKSIKSWLEQDDIEIFSTYNERKSVIAERFIRTLKNKIYIYMTLVSKIVYIEKLNELNHSTTKMKPVDVKYIESSKETKNKYSKLKIYYTVRISKYKI